MTYSQKKLGKYILTLPYGFRAAVKRAIIIAENEKGNPVYNREVIRAYPRVSNIPMLNPLLLCITIFDLYRNDEVLADPMIEKLSMLQTN